MKVLIVGAGMIGGHAALRLRGRGDQVVLAGRTAPAADSPFADFAFLRLDFLDENLEPTLFAGFDAMIFTAGQDPRHVAGRDAAAYLDGDSEEGRYLAKANGEGVPRFFARLRDAGAEVAINIGTLYPQAAPHLLEGNAYMRSRRDADAGVCALARPGFRAMTLNPSWVMGVIPGQALPLWERHLLYAAGLLESLPVFAPPGGINLISTSSISDAIEGALDRGEGGRSYLLGDENVTHQQFLGAFFEGFGKPPPPIVDAPHPIVSDRAIQRNRPIWYEPDPADAALLAYRRRDALRAIREEMIPEFKRRLALP
jgi:nucleoside-diphosphate-sugar epimerase